MQRPSVDVEKERGSKNRISGRRRRTQGRRQVRRKKGRSKKPDNIRKEIRI
jgi:hypothetical protein